MSTPLTDSINALTTYANEVTGASDTNLSDAVHTLASGYGQGGGVNYLDSVTRLSSIFNASHNMPQKIEFSPTQLVSGNNHGYFVTRAYEDTTNERATIDLIVHFQQTTPFGLRYFLYQAYGIKTVTLTGDLSVVTDYNYMLDYDANLQILDALFDFTSCTTDQNLCSSGSAGLITEMRFKENTASVSLNLERIGSGNMTNTTLISIANCLVSGVSQTLTLHWKSKQNCSSIMGNNDNGTFVADENGAMSLADFITTVKGWTLA